jgi:hypothetical protein
VPSELNSMERGIDIQRRRKYQKSTDCQAGDLKQALIRTAVAKTNSNMPLSKITNLQY